MPLDISDGPRADLIFTFADTHVPTVFDDDSTHGMQHLMKRVDFIVRSQDETWLIEVNDPDNRIAPSNPATAALRDKFVEEFLSGKLCDAALAPKFKDTLLYLALSNQASNNRLKYIVVVGLDDLEPIQLQAITDKLKRLCYLPGPFNKPWPSNFDVQVFNTATWNRYLAPHSVRRKSDSDV